MVGEIEDKIDRFYSSIKSRMMVGEVITNIENNAHFTFDFLMLLTLASIIAFIGLGIKRNESMFNPLQTYKLKKLL